MKKFFVFAIMLCICIFVCTTALANDFVFSSEITETQNKISVKLLISPSVQNSYFVINAYNNQKVTASKIVMADTLEKDVVLNCKDKPDDIKVTIWNDIVNVKPVIEPVEYQSTTVEGIQ